MANNGFLVSDFLRRSLERKRLKNPAYSARAFARDLGVSHAFVSQLLSGKRKISLARAREVCMLLDITPSQKAKFLRAVTVQSVTKRGVVDVERILFNSSMNEEYTPIEVERFHFFNHWYHVAILDLTTCSDFQSDAEWIARRLSITPALAQSTIERLIRLKLLTRVNGKLNKTQNHLAVPTHKPEETIRSFHQQMIGKAVEALDCRQLEQYQSRSISGITLAIDPARIEEAKLKIAEFKRAMAELLTEGPTTEVFQLNVQFFPLTKIGTP